MEVINYLKRIGNGGIESFITNVSYGMKNIDIDYIILANYKTENIYQKNLEQNGAKVVYIREKKQSKIIALFDYYKYIRIHKNAILHLHASSSAEYLYAFIAKICGVKNIIYHIHSTPRTDNIGYLKKAKNLILDKYFNVIPNIRLACSYAAGKSIYKSMDFTVVKNGIITQKFIFNKQLRDKIRLELKFENKFVVGHMGRFSYAKNHVFLIDIFNEIYKKNRNSVLILIGNGELENQIKDKVHSLGLDKAVIFYGTTPNANEIYQAMDCFVFPSHFEGLGIVAIEAQAAGLKTLCSDVVPKEAQITDLLEYMSLSEAAEKWAEKILSYNNNYKRLNMSAEIKNAEYDILKTAKQLEELYCECKMQS